MGYTPREMPWPQLVARLRHMMVVTDMTEAEALAVSAANPSTAYYASDTHNIIVNGTAYGGDGSMVIDTEMSPSSTNPVQNKVITGALGDKQNSSDYLTTSELFNILT